MLGSHLWDYKHSYQLEANMRKSVYGFGFAISKLSSRWVNEKWKWYRLSGSWPHKKCKSPHIMTFSWFRGYEFCQLRTACVKISVTQSIIHVILHLTHITGRKAWTEEEKSALRHHFATSWGQVPGKREIEHFKKCNPRCDREWKNIKHYVRYLMKK